LQRWARWMWPPDVLTHRLSGAWTKYRNRQHFPPFPNYHIRTNAFMIRRDTLLKLRVSRFRTKVDAWRFESGRHSMTRQVLAMGLRPLVVGRDGLAYEKERWFESGTFRSKGQENLLVADNRTGEYDAATAEQRELMSRRVWGRAT
jgi:hypothetical protein